MSSATTQSQFLVLASMLQFLRAAAWFTAGAILAVQAIEPSIGASMPVLRSLFFSSGTLALLAAVFVADGVVQVWAGYHVSMWRKSRMWALAVAIPAIDCIAWAVIGLQLEGRGEFGFGLAGFIFCGFAALAALGVAAGRQSLSGRF